METVKDTILRLTRQHIEYGGVIMAQNLIGPNSLQGTLPPEFTYETPGIMELPTQDSSNGAIAVGTALAGKLTMYVIRFQGFTWINLWPIVSYANKCLEMWDRHISMFIRAIGVEGQIGPVAGGTFHSLAIQGNLPTYAPMTPYEWEYVFNMQFRTSHPIFCSEHRGSYGNTDFSMEDVYDAGSDIIVVGIGAARLKLKQVREAFNNEISTAGIFELSDCYIPWELEKMIRAAGEDCKVLVVDSDSTPCGAAEHVAMELHTIWGVKTVRTLGRRCAVSGFSKESDVLTPNVNEIVEYVKGMR